MAVEALSFSTLTDLANNPPYRPRDINEHSPQDSITLYIAAVPGQRDLVLTPLRPRERLTVEDIAANLYLLRYDDIADYQVRSRQWGTFGRVPTTRGRKGRKGLPETANVHPAMRSSPERDARIALGNEKRQNQVDEQLTIEARNDDILSYQIPADNVRNAKQESLAEQGLVGSGDATLTLIRSDSAYGSADVVAKILDPRLDKDSSAGCDRPAYIDILNHGYSEFGEDVKYTEPEGGVCFTRRLYHESRLPTPKLTFLTPQRTFCVFEFGHRTMECYQLIPSIIDPSCPPYKVPVSSLRFNIHTSSSRARPQQATRGSEDTVSSYTATNDPSTSNKRRSRINWNAISNASSYSDEKDRKRLHRISGFIQTHARTSSSAIRRSFQSSSKGSDSTASSPTDSDLSYAIFGNRRRSTSSSDVLQQGFSALASGNGAVNKDEMQRSLNHDFVGLDGTAKLGKLIIYDAGQDFLDLLVAANMVAFGRLYNMVVANATQTGG